MKLLLIILSLVIAVSSYADEIVFIGNPTVKVFTTPENNQKKNLSVEESDEFQVVIMLLDGDFYWVSRGMKKLIKSGAGAYDTYHAIDGSGYVRVIKDDMEPMLVNTKNNITYVEHLVHNLSSISYYGVKQ